MEFVIAVCPKCGWWTKPSWDGHRPACINCLRKSKHFNGDTGHVTAGDLEIARRCKLVTVVPAAKVNPFSRRRGTIKSPTPRKLRTKKEKIAA